MEPKGKGRPMFRTVPRSEAPFIEREIDAQTGAPIQREEGEPPRSRLIRHYALKNVRPMAYGESTTEHEAKIRNSITAQIAAAEGFNTETSAVTIDWVAYFPPLMSDNRRNKEAKARGLVPHIKKPDKDNIEKLILDAMNTLVFFDDCQVNFGTSAKVYSFREGIRARIYRSDPEEVAAWVSDNFPWEEEEFKLEG